jgi:methyl-accepting chemotaxis protein
MSFFSLRGVSASVRELEIKKKTPILRGFIIAILVLVPILAISDFVTGDIVFGFVETGVIGLFAACFLLLRKGRYSLASYLAAGLAWLALAFIGFSGDATIAIAIFRLVVYLFVTTAFACFFLLDLVVPVIMSSVNFAIIVLFFIFRIKAPLLGGGSGNDFIVAVFFNFILNFIVLQLARLGRFIGEDLEKEKKKDAERLAVMRDAAEKSESNLSSIGSLAQRVEDIRSSTGAIADAVGLISKGLGELDRAADAATLEAGAIGEKMRDLNGHIESESAAQIESAASVNQMVASIGSVADSVKKRREGMRQLIGTAEEGEAKLKGLLAVIARVEGSAAAVGQLAGVINKIAASTNLLAMNASIEAAHAGDAGRGFSVVAEEIRNLAENSARNAKDIGQKLKEVVIAVSDAAGQSSTVTQAFAKIREGIDGTIVSFDEIKSATGELSEGGRQILESIKILNDASSGVRDGGNAILSAQGRLLDLQREAKEAVHEVSKAVSVVEERNGGLLTTASAVSEVAAQGAKRAEELHATMTSAGIGEGAAGIGQG